MDTTPWLSERVKLRAHDGPFIVIAVHKDRQTVDLLPISDSLKHCLEDVPFSQLLRSTEAGA